MKSFADVAELADAQVSEACDGDIVEVQVLSSAPVPSDFGELQIWAACCITKTFDLTMVVLFERVSQHS